MSRSWMSQIDRREDMQQETFDIIAQIATKASIDVMRNDAYGLFGCLRAIYPMVHMRIDEAASKDIKKRMDEASNTLFTTLEDDDGIGAEKISEIFDDLYDVWLVFTKELHSAGVLLKVRVPIDELAAHGVAR